MGNRGPGFPYREDGWNSTGADLIAVERRRQIEVEGWTAEHDEAYDDDELLAAAEWYWCEAARLQPRSEWPWAWSWWKPSADVVRNAVKAGALVQAEIDRRRRASQLDRDTLVRLTRTVLRLTRFIDGVLSVRLVDEDMAALRRGDDRG